MTSTSDLLTSGAWKRLPDAQKLLIRNRLVGGPLQACLAVFPIVAEFPHAGPHR